MKNDQRSKDKKLLKILSILFDLSQSELEIYKKLLEKKRIIVSDLVSEIKYSKRTIQDSLKKLYEKGLIFREISKKSKRMYEYYAKDPKKILKEILKELKELIEEE